MQQLEPLLIITGRVQAVTLLLGIGTRKEAIGGDLLAWLLALTGLN